MHPAIAAVSMLAGSLYLAAKTRGLGVAPVEVAEIVEDPSLKTARYMVYVAESNQDPRWIEAAAAAVLQAEQKVGRTVEVVMMRRKIEAWR